FTGNKSESEFEASGAYIFRPQSEDSYSGSDTRTITCVKTEIVQTAQMCQKNTFKANPIEYFIMRRQFCLLCMKQDKIAKSNYYTVSSIAVERKLTQTYESLHHKKLSHALLNEQVHKTCYDKYRSRYHNSQISVRASSLFSNPNTRIPLPNSMNNTSPTPLLTETSNGSLLTIDGKRQIRTLSSITWVPAETVDQRLKLTDEIDTYNLTSLTNPKDSPLFMRYCDRKASLKRRSTAKRKLDYEQDNLLVLSTPTRTTNSLYSNDMLATRQSRLQERTTSSPSIKSKFRKNLYKQRVCSADRRRCSHHNNSQISIDRSTFTYLSNDIQKSSLYPDGFEEMCGWLEDTLRTGALISLTKIQEIFQHLSQHRNEPLSQSTLRTTSIRERLNQRYGDKLHFTKLSKRGGMYVCLNDLSYHALLALKNSSSDSITHNTYRPILNHISAEEKQRKCEILFDAVQILRQTVNDNYHFFKKLKEDRQKLAAFTSNLYWDCAPTLLKNIIGMLTSNDVQFQNFKREYATLHTTFSTTTFIDRLRNR
ncbi:unnamed protein product, partial [Didymodactylos carnosus]